MEFFQKSQYESIGDAPAWLPIIPPRRRPATRIPPRNDWRQYERVKRRLAAQYGPGSEAYDIALEAFLEDARL
jgi:hypothetical protein